MKFARKAAVSRISRSGCFPDLNSSLPALEPASNRKTRQETTAKDAHLPSSYLTLPRGLAASSLSTPNSGWWESTHLHKLHAPPPLPKTPNKNPYPFLIGEPAIFEARALALLPVPGIVKSFPLPLKTVLVVWIGIGFRDRTFGYTPSIQRASEWHNLPAPRS